METHSLHPPAGTGVIKQESLSPRPSAHVSPSRQGPIDHVHEHAPEIPAFHLGQENERAIQILEKLIRTLRAAEGEARVSQFLQRLIALKDGAQPPQTLIGVVGNTGSGKSSVINALLEEEMLVPTNCMRACTSVITEISWNHSKDPEEFYRAEIEFIAPEDWDKELGELYGDLMNSKGEVSSECTNTETEAGVAWAKIKATYPEYTKEMLSATTAPALANLPEIRGILGTTVQVRNSSSKLFHEELQKYIDSADKNTEASKPKRKKDEKKTRELWPLIKVVRIFTKSETLSTGAIIVDLPGVQDSNAARAAVAEKYIEKCSGLWIVAPITRAVDDKTAQHLLGQSFKLQLLYDGTYSNITFICSKTDDISVTEAVESLHLENDVDDCKESIERIRREIADTMSQKEELHRKSKDIIFSFNETKESLETWRQLRYQLRRGMAVYPPDTTPRKRKKPTQQTPTPTKSKVVALDSYGEESSDTEDGDSDGGFYQSSDKDQAEPLSIEQVESQMNQLRETRDRQRQTQQDIKSELRRLDEKLSDLKSQLDANNSYLVSICIQGRNACSRGAIAADFAHGIRLMDQEAAMREHGELVDPENDLRDYDEVARSLPVFCVSGRAYQKAQGRLQMDKSVPGFVDVKDTEIPALQRHAKELAKVARDNSRRKFMTNFLQQLNSLALWAQDQSVEWKLTGDQENTETTRLQGRFEALRKDLESTASGTVNKCRETMRLHLFRKFDAAVQKAADASTNTAQGWGGDRNSGGLPWATYKAVCRRRGNHTGSLGHRDFNEELIRPLKENMASSWEQTFARRIPRALGEFCPASQKLLDRFHDETKKQVSRPGLPGLAMIDVQSKVHSMTIKNKLEEFHEKTVALQREASREFVPSVARSMAGAYTACSMESGLGSFARMKSAMGNHVLDYQQTMFDLAAAATRRKLGDVCDEMEKELISTISAVLCAMESEYTHVIIGCEVSEASKKAQNDVACILAQIDDDFREEIFAEEEGGRLW